MQLLGQIHSLLRVPRLTRPRMFFALATAAIADAIQMLLAEVGWLGFDQAIDVAAMVIVSWLLGFHFLFLPTFVVELVPLVEDLPTWTACTAAVIALRKRDQRQAPYRPPPPKPVIDV